MSVYLEHNGEQFGPFTLTQAKQYIGEGRFDASDLGWIEGMGDWQPIAEIPALCDALMTKEPEVVPPIAPAYVPVQSFTQPGLQPLPVSPYPPPTFQGYAPERTSESEFASFSRRAAAFGIDAAIAATVMSFAAVTFVFIFGLGMTSLGASFVDETTNLALAFAFFIMLLCIWIGYFAFFHTTNSMAGPGKMIFGLTVVDLQGRRLAFPQSFWRECVRVLASLVLFLTYFTQPFTARRQTVHDLLSNTLVLRKSADAGLPAIAVWVVNVIIAAVLAIFLLTLIGISA